MYYACGTLSSVLLGECLPQVPVWLGVSHVKCSDSRPPPGQRRGWRRFDRIHGASGCAARCGHCSDRQRRGLGRRPVVVSVQGSARRYLLIADGLLLRAAAFGYAAKNSWHHAVTGIHPREPSPPSQKAAWSTTLTVKQALSASPPQPKDGARRTGPERRSLCEVARTIVACWASGGDR